MAVPDCSRLASRCHLHWHRAFLRWLQLPLLLWLCLHYCVHQRLPAPLQVWHFTEPWVPGPTAVVVACSTSRNSTTL